jgi:hypothetical protein
MARSGRKQEETKPEVDQNEDTSKPVDENYAENDAQNDTPEVQVGKEETPEVENQNDTPDDVPFSGAIIIDDPKKLPEEVLNIATQEDKYCPSSNTMLGEDYPCTDCDGCDTYVVEPNEDLVTPTPIQMFEVKHELFTEENTFVMKSEQNDFGRSRHYTVLAKKPNILEYSGETIQTCANIDVQEGAREENGVGVNGIFVEDLILIAVDLITVYNSGKFVNAYNAMAIEHLLHAKKCLQQRADERKESGVLGKRTP